MIIVAATIVSAVATSLIAWFNFQMVGVSDEMKKATNRAADAAHESAEAAKAALHLNRPAIIVTYMEPHVGPHRPSGKSDVLIGYTPQICNLGSGAAEIIGIWSHTMVFDFYDQNLTLAEEPRVADLF